MIEANQRVPRRGVANRFGAPGRPDPGAGTAPTPADPTTSEASVGEEAGAAGPQPGKNLKWWVEVAIVVGFYAVYTYVRNRFGSASVSAERAFANAQRVIEVEQHLGIFNEQALQDFLASAHLPALFWNTFYASLHFVVTIGTLVVLFRRWPDDYRRLRNVLAFTTALALVGFSFFPLMPPRLLCDCPYGAGPDAAHYGFVDTLARDGGLWSFGSQGMKAVSNQYAAMPSLHFAWALFCALALYPRLRERWPRGVALAALYPALTLVAVTVTANHFWLDALGGAVVLGAGWLCASVFTSWTERRRNAVNREDISGVLVLDEE